MVGSNLAKNTLRCSVMKCPDLSCRKRRRSIKGFFFTNETLREAVLKWCGYEEEKNEMIAKIW